MESKFSWFLPVLIFLATTCRVGANDDARSLILRAQFDALHPDLPRLSSSEKKSCSEVFPLPEAAKHWTQCEEGEYSGCGGPPQCACKSDERLFSIQCKEGSYFICKDNDTCADDD